MCHDAALKGCHVRKNPLHSLVHVKINPFQHLQPFIGQFQEGYPSVMRRNTPEDQSFSSQGLGLAAESGYINPQFVSHPLHGGTPDPPYFQKYMALGQ